MGIVLVIKIWPYYQMVYIWNRIKDYEMYRLFYDFEIQTYHQILVRRQNLGLIYK